VGKSCSVASLTALSRGKGSVKGVKVDHDAALPDDEG